MIETLAHGYSTESAQRELSNEYQHDRVLMVFKNLRILVLWTKVAYALERVKSYFFIDHFKITLQYNVELTISMLYILYFLLFSSTLLSHPRVWLEEEFKRLQLAKRAVRK